MMTPMRYHPVPGATALGKYPFGFDAVMAAPDHGRFRRYYDAMSFLPPGRAAAAGVPGAAEPEPMAEAA